ncbi:MAG: 16S rRNA (cytosine(1402)-N(4))-methyltransferase RsmH [Chlamydiae bacterium]|nr:16S rRNA (cytosine(1402)-N(4))-methyltransferase RsmH [Chlamydiota bacterium]
MSPNKHISVLLQPFLDFFKGSNIRTFFDGTLGAAGHAKALLKEHPEIELFIGCDQDKEALSLAKENLKEWEKKVKLFHGSFVDMDKYLDQLKTPCVDGIFIDLGISSMQIDSEVRGFSFRFNAPLDMRMNTEMELTARDIINSYSEKELEFIFKEYGEEPQYKQAAKAIIATRRRRKIETTQDLIDVLSGVLRKKRGHHPLTLVFQALRIAVNDELNSLKAFLAKGIQRLCEKGKIGVISFHSLEDRIVKNFFKEHQEMIEILTKKPVAPDYIECRKNRRARSAKMRFAMRGKNE